MLASWPSAPVSSFCLHSFQSLPPPGREVFVFPPLYLQLEVGHFTGVQCGRSSDAEHDAKLEGHGRRLPSSDIKNARCASDLHPEPGRGGAHEHQPALFVSMRDAPLRLCLLPARPAHGWPCSDAHQCMHGLLEGHSSGPALPPYPRAADGAGLAVGQQPGGADLAGGAVAAWRQKAGGSGQAGGQPLRKT